MRLLPVLPPHKVLRLIVVLATAPTAVNAAEQIDGQTDEQTDQPIRLIVSAERAPQAQQLAPLSLGVIDADTLALQPAEHVLYWLNRLPGVQFQRNDGQEYLAAIRSPVLTGAGSCGAFLSLENSVPIRPAPFCNVNELSEAFSEAAEQLEVIRGPALPFYGANAMHGAVNVLTPAAGENRVRLRLTETESAETDGADLLLQLADDDQSFALSARNETSWRDDAGIEQYKIGWRHRGERASRASEPVQIETLFTASKLMQETAGFVNGTNAYRDLHRVRQNDNPEAFRDSDSLRLVQHWRWQDGTTVTPYLRRTEMTFLQHFLPGQPLERNGHWSAGLQWQQPVWQSESQQLLLGTDIEYAETFLEEWQTQITEGSAFLQETIPVGFHYDYTVALQGVAPFLHWRWQFAEPWQLFVGARAERWWYDYDNRMLSGRSRDDGSLCGFDGCRFNRPADRSDQFTLLSPKAGLSWQPLAGQRLNLLLQHGFRPPQTTELYRLQREQSVADLDPEELRGLELNWRAAWTADLRTELAWYGYDKANVIVRNTDSFTISDARTTHRGIEAQLDWAFATDWQLLLTATWQRHRYANNPGISAQDIVGNRIDTAPDRFGFAALRWQPLPNAQLELAATHTDGYYTDAENSRYYPGHSLLDLRWRQQTETGWAWTLALQNLTNRPYAERADYTGASGDRYMPGAPRQLQLSFEMPL